MAENDMKNALSSDQVKAINALMKGGTIAAAAKASKISERTLYRWLDDPNFRAELEAAKARAIEAAVRRLADLMMDAANVLAQAMKKKATATQVRAASFILTHSPNLFALTDFESRLSAIERNLENEERTGKTTQET